MKNENYYITQEQLELIEHYQRMFKLNSEYIQDICKCEQDEIIYGFELGKIHSHLNNCFVDMMQLTDDIKKQNIKIKNK